MEINTWSEQRSQFYRAGAGVGFGKPWDVVCSSSLDPFSVLRELREGRGEEGNLERRGERERRPEVNFHSGLMGLNALAINRTKPSPPPFHSSDVSIRLFPRLHPSPPHPILSLSSAAMPDINLLALDKSRAWPVKLFPPVAANLKRSRLLRISVISDDNQSKVVVEKKTAYRSVWFEKVWVFIYI